RDVCLDAAAGGLRLGATCESAISPVEPGGSFGGATRPTGLAVGPDGRLFLADPAGNQVLTYTTHLGAFVPLWAPRLPEETVAVPPNDDPAAPCADGRTEP